MPPLFTLNASPATSALVMDAVLSYNSCRNHGGEPMKAVVTTKGQVTIPKALRDSLGILRGTVLDFREESGRLIVCKATIEDPVAAVRGVLVDSRSSDEIVAELRGSV